MGADSPSDSHSKNDADPTPANGRLPALDVLRGLAILLVLGRHMPAAEGEALSDSIFQSITSMWRLGGWIGVDLFFVLSGFLVTGLLLREYIERSRVNAGRFLIRRAFKIYPAFWACLIFELTCQAACGWEITGSSILCELLFGQGYLLPVFNHTWSLAVEEYFYLMIAVLMTALAVTGRGRSARATFALLPKLAFGLAVTLVLWRIANVAVYHLAARDNLFITHLRFDALMAGAVLAYLYHCHRDAFLGFCRRRRSALLVAAAALFAPAFFVEVEQSDVLATVGLTGMFVGGALLVCGAIGAAGVPWLLCVVGWMGAYSYSIYLWHVPVHRWFLPGAREVLSVGAGTTADIAIYLLLSTGLGILMMRVVEAPFLALRERVAPTRRDLPHPEPAGLIERSRVAVALND